MPALLTLSHDLAANGGNDDDDVVVYPSFGIRGKSISGHTGRQTSVCQLSRNRMEWRHWRTRNPSHGQSGDNAYSKNAVGRDFQNWIHGFKVARGKTTRNSTRLFVVTDNRIVLLNEEDNDAAAKKISAMDKPPEFEPNDIYGITAAASNIRKESGKPQSNWKATSVFMRRAIPQDISKKSSGKRASA
jgi:hypothetical protein